MKSYGKFLLRVISILLVCTLCTTGAFASDVDATITRENVEDYLIDFEDIPIEDFFVASDGSHIPVHYNPNSSNLFTEKQRTEGGIDEKSYIISTTETLPLNPTSRATTTDVLAELVEFNNIVQPQLTSSLNEPEFSYDSFIEESISEYSGDLTLRFEDLVLDGRNGLDLTIGRTYQSIASHDGAPYLVLLPANNTIGVKGNWICDPSSYLLDRYNLGSGWSFNFPSVQIEKEYVAELVQDTFHYDVEQELYYHTGDGATYHVVFTDDITDDSNLENYDKKDIVFQKNDTGYLNADNIRSFYSLTKIDGSKQYFAEDGRLLGITDRFGNKIDFEYEMYPLVNRMPGGTFDCQDTMWSIVGTKNYDFEKTIGQKDTTSLRVSANNYQDVIIRSQPIQVEPQGDYQFAASFYSTNGNEDITMTFHEYDLYHRSTGFTKTFTKEDLVQGEWNSFEAPYHITSSATRYVVLEITVEYGIYNLYIDNVTLDQPKPLISKITDTIGRTVTFDYVGSVFEGDNIGDVILTVSSPDGSQTKTMTYHKGSVTYTTTFVGKEDALTFWYLDYSDTEGSNGGDMSNKRNDNKTHYYYDGSVGPDGTHMNLYYHPNRKTYVSTDSYHHMHPLGGVMYKNRVKIYDYEVVRKHLGNNGYTDLLRVFERYETYFNYDVQDNIAYETGERNRIQFGYQGSYTDSSTGVTVTFDSEDGYPNYHFSNDTTFGEEWSCTKTSKKQETFTFTNAKLVRNSVSDSNTGISQTNYYEYDSTFSNQPSAIKNVVSNGSDARELYSLFSYDEKGNVASESHPVTVDIKNDATLLAKHTTSYEYSPHGFLTKKHYYQSVDSDRITEQNYYDSMGRLTKSVNAMGGETEYSYEDAAYPGNVTVVSQDDPANLHGLMVSQKSILYLYDDYGLYPEVTIDVSDGIVSNTFTGYDYIYGNLLYTVYPDEGVEQFCYNEDGSIAKHLYPIIQNNGSQFRMLEVYEYFASCEVDMGNGFYPLLERVIVKKYEYPEDWEEVYYHAQEEKFYSTSGNLLHQIVHDIADQHLNEEGQIATPAINSYYYYDNYDRLIKTVDALNQSVQYTYDNFDRVTTVTDPENNSYHYSYDDLDLTSNSCLQASSGEERNHLTVQSDIYGNILSLTAYPDGINGSTLTESFEYDLLGNCVEHTNPRGAVTQYSYDKVNRLTQTVLPDGTIAVSSYSEFDTPVTEKIKDAEGNDKLSRLYYYDGKGNTQTKFYHYNAKLTDVNSYSYDSKNRVIESSEYGQQFQYVYDQVNNLISKQSGNESIEYRYNQYGEVISASSDDSTALLVSNYDDMGRLKSRIQQKSVEEGLWITFNNQYAYSVLNQVIASASPLNRIETYTYTPNGNLQTIVTDGKTISYEYNASGAIKQINYPNGLKTVYEYDNINRVTQMITSKGSTIINQMQYAYDENSNIISETRNNQTTQYSYDSLDRLVQVEYPDRTVAYEYDTIGNRTKETITASDGTQVKEYSYNDRYQLIRIVTDGEVTDTYTYREDGALASHNDTEYEYDKWNRLSAVTTGETTDTFGYDTHGIRTEKNDIYYSIDHNQHVNLEYDTSDDSVAEIVWGHQPLARKVGNSWYYYIYNAHGDVIGLVNDAGTVVNNYTYDAWGNILSETEAVDNPIKYSGEYYDDELGMYYLRARYYDPKVGRFTSYDIEEGDIVNPLDMNRYVYCRNNPLKYIDPSGEFTISITTAIAAVFCFFVAVTATVGALYELSNIVSNIQDNRKHHILHGSNNSHEPGWRKFNIDPNDPNAWLKLLPILNEVVNNGTKSEWKQQATGVYVREITYYFSKLGETVKVIINKGADGIERITDAFTIFK